MKMTVRGLLALCLVASMVMAAQPLAVYDAESRAFFSLSGWPDIFNKNTLANLNTVKNQIRTLTTSVNAINTKLTALTTKVNGFSTPKCPEIGGTQSKELEGTCFIMYKNAVVFDTAVLNCFNAGGKLAEPTNPAAIFAKLNTAAFFLSEIATFDGTTDGFFIAAEYNLNNYRYLQSRAIIFTGTGTDKSVLAVNKVGGALTEVTPRLTKTNAYLCQFDKR